MNYLNKLKKQLKSEDKIPLLLVCGLKNWFAWITDRNMTAGQFYLLISDLFVIVDDWLKDRYGIADFMNETINIQRTSNLSQVERQLLTHYTEKDGWHSAISAMIILGLVPFLRTLNEDEIIPELDLCIKEINTYLKEVCSFSGKFISKNLKNEILVNLLDLKKEIA